MEPSHVNFAYFRPLFDYFESEGLPTARLMKAAGLDAQQLRDGDLMLADERVDPMFDAALDVSGDPLVGLRAGQIMAVKHLGVLGHLFMTCKRADEMFELHARYHALVATASRVRYQIAGDEVQLRLELTNPNGRSESGIRQFMEYSVAGWLNLIDLISDSNEYRPKVIEFPFAAPADNSVQRQVLGCELSYNASPSLCVRFDRHLLNTPYFSSAPNLRATIEQAARQRLRELRGRSEISHSELVNEISEFVRQGLMHGVPSIEQVAAYTGQPVRTLQRLLGEEGVDYRSLVEELRKELAKHYIAQSELSLLDVALMLGFSEQSSFQRAFRRWYGVTPGVYRARHEPR